ncbi:hypothetical protein [Pedobacter sp. UC225_65]|uniref:hypothetical protein n=1 Tax=Pedobacter sp. UC225_65 TaxID=3350173 RepID=UPI00366C609E
MKNEHILILGIGALLVSFTGLANAQEAPKPVSIEVLKTRDALLKETTKLNGLKIKLANAEAQTKKLEKDIVTANDLVTRSTKESKEMSAKMIANAGDQKLAKKAKSAAKTSYNDTKKAHQLADNLKSNQKSIVSLKANIEKSKVKIAKMDQQLKFSGAKTVK